MAGIRKFCNGLTTKHLTSGKGGLEYRKFLRICLSQRRGDASGFMTSKPFSQPSNAKEPCKHPRVQIVSREEDAEFVECLECREVFESSELKDMSIEETTDGEAQES